MTQEPADDSGVLLRVDGHVATVTLNRPDRLNSQTPATWRSLACIGAGLDPEIRVVVVRGEGRSFSAGLDRSLFPGGPAVADGLAATASGTDAQIAERIAAFQAGFSWLTRGRAISIAAVQGHAVGAGFQLALACDLRIVADDARFAMREVSLGVVPDLGGTKQLAGLVGYSRALELCATGRWVEAGEARDLGLATAVVPTPRLGEATADLVAALTEPLHGAVAATKQLLLGAGERTYDQQLHAERTAQAVRLRDFAAAFEQP